MYHSPIHQNQFVLIISALVFSCGTASARPDAIDGAAPVKQGVICAVNEVCVKFFHCENGYLVHVPEMFDFRNGVPICEDGNVCCKSNDTTFLNRKSDEDYSLCGRANQMGLNPNLLQFHSSTNTKTGEYPFIVAIMRKLKTQNSSEYTLLYSGAGSLIHPSVVLSAANKHQATKLDIIRAGEWDFSATNEPDPHQDRIIDDVHEFTDTLNRHADTVEFDNVQLIFVTQPFDLAPNVQTVCLPSPTVPITTAERSDCITAAWGQQSCSRQRGLSSIQGRQELLLLTNRQSCTSNWRDYLEDVSFSLRDYFFCAKRSDKASWDDRCFCDHGAALICPFNRDDKTFYEQIGVALTTDGCKRELPVIYSNVAHFRPLIDAVFESKGLDTKYYTPR